MLWQGICEGSEGFVIAGEKTDYPEEEFRREDRKKTGNELSFASVPVDRCQSTYHRPFQKLAGRGWRVWCRMGNPSSGANLLQPSTSMGAWRKEKLWKSCLEVRIFRLFAFFCEIPFSWKQSDRNVLMWTDVGNTCNRIWTGWTGVVALPASSLGRPKTRVLNVCVLGVRLGLWHWDENLLAYVYCIVNLNFVSADAGNPYRRSPSEPFGRGQRLSILICTLTWHTQLVVHPENGNREL